MDDRGPKATEGDQFAPRWTDAGVEVQRHRALLRCGAQVLHVGQDVCRSGDGRRLIRAVRSKARTSWQQSCSRRACAV